MKGEGTRRCEREGEGERIRLRSQCSCARAVDVGSRVVEDGGASLVEAEVQGIKSIFFQRRGGEKR